MQPFRFDKIGHIILGQKRVHGGQNWALPKLRDDRASQVVLWPTSDILLIPPLKHCLRSHVIHV